MRTYRVTLFRAGEESTGEPIHYMGEVDWSALAQGTLQ